MSIHRTDADFPGAIFFLQPNRYRFSRKPFSNIIEQIGNFQEGTPLRTDISTIGLGGCFRHNNLHSQHPDEARSKMRAWDEFLSISTFNNIIMQHFVWSFSYISGNRQLFSRAFCFYRLWQYFRFRFMEKHFSMEKVLLLLKENNRSLFQYFWKLSLSALLRRFLLLKNIICSTTFLATSLRPWLGKLVTVR